jgi:hypothetical protein
MRAFFRWLARTVGSAVTIVLVIVLFPHISRLAARLLPDESGAAIRASAVLSTRLENSARLESLQVDETGVIAYDIKAALIGTVANIHVHYDYQASFGIDLRQVQLRIESGKLVFLLPEPELIQDALTPQEVARNDFWYPGFSDEDYQKLLEDERLIRRSHYLSGDGNAALRSATIEAFRSTIAAWMSEVDPNLTYQCEWLADAAQSAT